ncbi:hypothetical protein ACH5RR_039731 [Cinchona calisaya]|uniref:Pentatricopeptide repeat-containing protein At2g22410, mitochondrial-like n=1 Tax=Cinchona calisaya TaxID=153742 RepID=A0ABD2XZI8_9GENT
MFKSLKYSTVASRLNCTASFNYKVHSLIEQCSSMNSLKCLHARIIVHGLAHHELTVSKLIACSALSAFGDIQYAQILFDKMPQRNRYMYNSLIRGCASSEDPYKAILLYKQMVVSVILPNEFTFPFVLKACAIKEGYRDGVLIHLMAIKLGYESHVCVENGLINVYVRCGNVVYARKVFDEIVEKTLVSWNSMIGGYSRMGCGEQVLLLFRDMKERGVRPDGFTVMYLLSVCSQNCDLELGKFVHCNVVVNGIGVDVHVQNALLDVYAKCGDLNAAQTLFDRMVHRNVVSWTSLLTAYAKHGCLEVAKDIFSRMPVKNVVSWNSMISSYVREGHSQEALDLFFKMCKSEVKPDETTLVGVLSASCQLGDLVMGNKIHDYIRSNNIKCSVTLYNALVDMFSKCGSLVKAFDLFLEIPEKNIVSWNVMIGALAFHGIGHKAVQLFEEMQACGKWPDKITFIGLLSACCHSGLTDIGWYYFDKMSSIYGVPREIEHYVCMVDILGRGGFLDKAVKLIGRMPMKPDTAIWGALLGACRIHRNLTVAKQVLKQLLELEPYSSGCGLYVLVSNIYSEAQRWGEMKNIRKLMNDHGIKRHEAISSIEICGCSNEFMVSDQRHEDSSAIYIVLDQLMDHLRSDGHSCSLSPEPFGCGGDLVSWGVSS